MPLPSDIIQHPTFKLKLPSNGKQINFRPFTVKEEKVLLIAQQENTTEAFVDAVLQIVQNCITTKDVEVTKLPMFDIEYIFIKLRARSVSNILNLEIRDELGEPKHKFEVDLDTVEVKKTEGHTTLVELSDISGLKLRYPTALTYNKIKELNTAVDMTMGLLASCIGTIYKGDAIYVADTDFDLAEAIAFLEDLPTDIFEKLQTFFNTMPVLEHVLTYIENDKEEEVRLKGLPDFFR